MTRSVFADANILIAAAGSRQGASRAILNLAEMGLIQLVVSRQVLLETERNLRRKLPDGLPLVAEWLSYLSLKMVDDPLPERYMGWVSIIEEKDAPILAAAVDAQVDYLVTLNTRDFTPEVMNAAGLTILTPSQFIERVRDILQHNL
jgi:predicted nucleic acid-binding protein